MSARRRKTVLIVSFGHRVSGGLFYIKFTMKISFFTIGCKLNQAETEELKQELLDRGFDAVPFNQKADISVIRACGVTCGASRTTREIIRQAKRRGAYVIAVGCVENKNLPEIDFLAKDSEEVIHRVVILNECEGSLSQLDRDSSASASLRRDGSDSPRNDNKKTRAFIKIQTGCDYNCAYCAIPSFRGRSRSLPAEEIISKITKAEKNGCKEIALTGVNICLYKDGSLNLAGLLKKILKETKIPRIRLGSLDPRLITPDLIKLYASKNKRLMPHWHLSLQSGSGRILEKMNRHYTVKKYLEIIKNLRKQNPDFSFTTDIIVGFPGETENDFEKTLRLVSEAEFLKVHIFPFSPRSGTGAEKMTEQIPDKTKTARAERLAESAKKSSAKFIGKFMGKTKPALFEQKKSGFYSGYTPEYIRVKLKSATPNKFKNIKITPSLLGDQ